MDAVKALQEIEHSRKYNKIQYFQPYDFQKKFYSLKAENGKLAKVRGLMAANQIGKTLSEGAEVGYHATGNYPKWWEGHRVNKNPLIVCSGVNSYTTRDLIQLELLGTTDKDDKEVLGTGWIPKHLIHKIDRKPGIPGAAEKIYVKRNNGTELATILMLGFEDGASKYMGKRVDYGWADEEPPMPIWNQLVRGTIATDGKLAITYTPENGMTQLVYRLMHDCPNNYALMNATWEDAPHITPERREELLAEMMPFEREMRSQGKPLVGDSMIFPIPDEDILCDRINTDGYYFIIGIDFGGDHPFAVVKLAYHPDTKKAYIVDSYKERRLTVSQEASIIRRMGGDRIPVAWPHDGNKQDKNSGKPIADLYRAEGINMLDRCFSNPPEPFRDEHSGGQGVEHGIKKMFWDMTEGRLKVQSDQVEWFKEKASYHRKDGNVIRLQDDLMSATRYAHLSALNNDGSFRFAESPDQQSNFMRDLDVNLKFVR